MLECRANGTLFVINPSILMQYPLNDIVIEQLKNREIIASPLSTILLKQTDISRQKIDIPPFQKTAKILFKTNYKLIVKFYQDGLPSQFYLSEDD